MTERFAKKEKKKGAKRGVGWGGGEGGLLSGELHCQKKSFKHLGVGGKGGETVKKQRKDRLFGIAALKGGACEKLRRRGGQKTGDKPQQKLESGKKGHSRQ